MKKNPGRKERRRLERRMRRENGKRLQHMWIVNQRKEFKEKMREAKELRERYKAMIAKAAEA